MDIVVANIEMIRDQNKVPTQVIVRFNGSTEGSSAQINGHVPMTPEEYFPNASDDTLLSNLVKQKLTSELA